MVELCGQLRKMAVAAGVPARYWLRLDEREIPLEERLGDRLRIDFTGEIHCLACGRRTAKSFAQGHCYPCFRRLARCDRCILRPELCHYERGTCREPDWAQGHCFVPHLVYLANTAGPKVGLTRESEVPTRWLDQGAVQALPVLRTATRQQAGFVEDLLRARVGDRTDWRAMLRGDPEPLDLPGLWRRLEGELASGLDALRQRFGEEAIASLPSAACFSACYPVLEPPPRLRAFDLAKIARVEGRLLGIKGQYLLLDSGVFNVRKHGGYRVTVTFF